MVMVILACGPDYPGNYFSGVFMPQSARTPSGSARYYFSPAFLYENNNYAWDYRDYRDEPDPNLKQWKDYCHVQLSDSAAALLIYEGKDDRANPLYQSLRLIPGAWQYLLLARNIEAACAAGGSRWEPKPADSVRMKLYFNQVVDSLKKVRDPFLRSKYSFQAVKLAHLLHRNDSCIALYDAYFGDSKDSSIMKWWSLSHKAGALLDKGDTAQAVYVFAQVFDHCISRRQAAYMSLRMNHIRFVADALNYCKNDEEKAAVYTLCAIQPWVDALPLMEAMVKLAPNDPFLELIMTREINKNENFYFERPNDYYRTDTTGKGLQREKAADYFDLLGRFAIACGRNQVVKDKAFWHAAAAYTRYIKGDFEKSGHLLTDAEQEVSDNPKLAEQIRLQKLLLATARAKQMSPALERKVLPMINNLKKAIDFSQYEVNFYMTNALDKGCRRLIALYKEVPAKSRSHEGWLCNKPKTPNWGRFASAKALLLTLVSPFAEIDDTTSDVVLDNLIAFFRQPHPQPQDSLFMRLTRFTLNDFYLVKGRRAMQKFDFDQAVDAWKQVADTFWHREPFGSELNADPFASYVLDRDRMTGNNTARYTPYSFALRMQRLSRSVRNNPTQAARYYYMLGCGAYNMSYYGNSWLITKADRSGAELPYDVSDSLRAVDSINYYTTIRAGLYFDSAMKSAGADHALGARACFMAAKCEQNAFYIFCAQHQLWDALADRFYFSPDSYKRQRDSLKQIAEQLRGNHFSHYFGILKSRYSNDEYTQQIIRECATYRDFARGNK